MAGLKGFDNEAWDKLVRLYTPLVYHWCQRLDMPRDDIPDVVQELFATVAAKIGQFRKERPGDSFRGWLRVITRRKSIDVFRKKGKEPQGEGGTEALRRLDGVPDHRQGMPGEEGELELNDDPEAKSIIYNQALEEIRGEFREPTWKAFWGIVVDGRPPKDVADELGLSPGAVRVAKCRGLQKLKKELGDTPLD